MLTWRMLKVLLSVQMTALASEALPDRPSVDLNCSLKHCQSVFNASADDIDIRGRVVLSQNAEKLWW